MKIFIALCFIAAVSCHSWMESPLGGYNITNVPSASQVSPCGDDKNYPAPIDIIQGRSINVVWPGNGHNNDVVKFYFYDANNTQVLQLAPTDGIAYTNNNGGNNNADSSFNVRIPFNTPVGSYKFSWQWTGYYTCALVNVIASSVPVTPLPTGTSINGVLPTNTLDYYHIDQSTLGNLAMSLISVSGPTGAAFATVYTGTANNSIPTTTEFGMALNTAASSPVSFGTCNDGNQGDVIVGVQGNTAAAGQPYSISVNTYNGLVNVGNPSLVSGPHSGFRYAATQAFETFGQPRRVVIRGSSPITTAPFDFKVASNCAMTQNIVQGNLVGVQTACLQLGTRQGIKYIQVPPMNVDYTLSTENGSCLDVSSASTLPSFITLLAGLLAFVACYML